MADIKPLAGKARAAVALADRRLNVWEGAVRSSKTVSSLMAWVAFVRKGPPGNLMMVAKTERTLKRNIIDVLVTWFGPQRARYVAGSGELHLFGRRIYLVGANDEKAQDKVRGVSLVGVYADEISLFPESMWTMLLSRLSTSGARLYATTNPDSPGLWLMRDFLSRPALHLTGRGEILRSEGDQVLDLARFSFTLDDNPHLDAGYVNSLKREYVGLWYKRYIEGLWVVAEGSIYPHWNPDVHVVPFDNLPAMVRWFGVGVDHGTTNPFAANVLALGEDRRLYLTHEYRWDSRRERQQLSDVEYSKRLRGFLSEARIPGSDLVGVAPEWVVVDPSATAFRVQLQRDGIMSHSADNEVLDGIRQFGSLLAGDQLRVSDRCKGFIDEIPGYVWDPKQTAKGVDAPIKLNDHHMDDCRYVTRTTRALWRSQVRPPVVSDQNMRMAA